MDKFEMANSTIAELEYRSLTLDQVIERCNKIEVISDTVRSLGIQAVGRGDDELLLHFSNGFSIDAWTSPEQIVAFCLYYFGFSELKFVEFETKNIYSQEFTADVYAHVLFEKIGANQIVIDFQFFTETNLVIGDFLGVQIAYFESSETVEEKCKNFLIQLTENDKLIVDGKKSLFALGLDSLMGMGFQKLVAENIHVTIPLTIIFQQESFNTIVEFIKSAPKEEINATQKSVGVVDLATPFPLTEIQQAYFLGRQSDFNLGMVATHIYIELENPDLDYARFEKAINMLITNQQMLRTKFKKDGTQVIGSSVEYYKVPVKDLSALSDDEANKQYKMLRDEIEFSLLNCETGPLFSFQLVKFSSGKTRIQFYLDMLIADAMSFQLFCNQLAIYYDNPEIPVKPLEYTFKHYVLEDQKNKLTPSYAKSVVYWKEAIKYIPPGPELTIVRSEKLDGHETNRLSFSLNKAKWDNLKSKLKDGNITPSTFILGLFGEVLNRWSASPKFSVNMTVFNRPSYHEQIVELIGDFTNLILVPFDFSKKCDLSTRLNELQTTILNHLEHIQVGCLQVQREYAKHHRIINDGLFPVVFTSLLSHHQQKMSENVSRLGDIVYNQSQTSQVWIDHIVTEDSGDLVIFWDYVKHLFPEDYIRDMFSCFSMALERLSECIDWAVDATLIELPQYQVAIIENLNATSTNELPSLLHAKFEENSLLHGDYIAVIQGNNTFSYRDLNSRANQWANLFSQELDGDVKTIAVVLPKSFDQIAVILGILKTGRAYIPIDSDWPLERQQNVLRQSQTQAAIINEFDGSNRLASVDIQYFNLGMIKIFDYSTDSPNVQVSPEDLAYIMFTSGSTGAPKGVAMPHQGPSNTVLDIIKRFSINEKDKVLGISSYSFDLSVFDIFGILAAGGALVLPDPGKEKDPQHWLSLIQTHDISTWNTVPALISLLVEVAKKQEKSFSNLTHIFLSGDAIPMHLPKSIWEVSSGSKVISLGGPTETSIWSVSFPINAIDDNWPSIPYGHPLSNQQIHIMDEQLNLRPFYVPGEMIISGRCLANGYWLADNLTNEKFIQFGAGKRGYKSGDMGRYLHDGTIEILGRNDFQVKINGNRIEIGEIENVLSGLDGISSAVVAVQPNESVQQLVAYVVKSNKTTKISPEKTSNLENIILDPLERADFKLQQHGIRTDKRDYPSVALEKPLMMDSETELNYFRKSVREFSTDQISIKQLSGLLACLKQRQKNGLPKYQYGSAGGLYPVQCYLYIKENKVKDFAAGFYYYDPVDHALRLLNCEDQFPDALHESTNQGFISQASFYIILVSRDSAIHPMYGKLSTSFSLLEGGAISQILETEAGGYGLGLCQVGFNNFEQIRTPMHCGTDYTYIHMCVGGSLAGSVKLDPPSRLVENDEKNIIAQISKRLPDYMVPRRVIFIDEIPLTPNGKVNRKALPNPFKGNKKPLEQNQTRPSPFEQMILDIWNDQSTTQTIGVMDEFVSVGFDSLQGVKFISEIRQILGVDLKIRNLIEFASIRNMCIHLVEQIPPPKLAEILALYVNAGGLSESDLKKELHDE